MEFSETIAQHHERIGRPGVGRGVIAGMRRALALRQSGVTDPGTIRAKAKISWWVAEQSTEELLGWLEIDRQGQPLIKQLDELYHLAAPEAGNGWTLTFDPDWAHSGDSYKVWAHRDRRPPLSRKGVVKVSSAIGEYLFYRLARWLNLPAMPVQIIDVPPHIYSYEDAFLLNAGKETGSSDRVGFLIWWMTGATHDENLATDWDDYETMNLVALNAIAADTEGGESWRAPGGTPLLLDHQYSFLPITNPGAGFSSETLINYWKERLATAPTSALWDWRLTWSRIADLEPVECLAIMGAVPIAGFEWDVLRGWPAVQAWASMLVKAAKKELRKRE